MYSDVELHEPGSRERFTGLHAAITILTDKRNLDIQLRNKGVGSSPGAEENKYRFRDRMSEFMCILEQMIDHQADMKAEEGIGFNVMLSPWEQLEGFDFWDIAGRCSDPLSSKGVKLKGDAEGWVGFTREIHAITLFGRGFGELLVPKQTNPFNQQICSRCFWNVPVPCGRDLLAVTLADLETLHKREPQWGVTSPGERLVVQKFVWERPASCFTACTCSSTHQRRPEAGRVQTFRLLSEDGVSIVRIAKSPMKKAPKDEGQVSRRGAVLLGIHQAVLQKPSLSPGNASFRVETGRSPTSSTLLGVGSSILRLGRKSSSTKSSLQDSSSRKSDTTISHSQETSTTTRESLAGSSSSISSLEQTSRGPGGPGSPHPNDRNESQDQETTTLACGPSTQLKPNIVVAADSRASNTQSPPSETALDDEWPRLPSPQPLTASSTVRPIISSNFVGTPSANNKAWKKKYGLMRSR
ncbi:hypothetical protein BX600DRAFT_460483 [Xylariales sp. PMI_506]|nr:hypothetical protein BX600DRAFT_460483 [Xylariales sp. PMI_506]